MSTFERSGHWRTNAYGTTFWVSSHSVSRDHWEREMGLRDLRRSDASSKLKRFSAHSLVSCYVNPNAKCLVCGASVFYYANEHGSRVFFDTLGPPWPKHPCTDNPAKPLVGPAPVFREPERRTRGLTEELLQAAREAGFDGALSQQGGWHLFAVNEARSDKNRHVVMAEGITTASGRPVEISYIYEKAIINRGDLVSFDGQSVSFLHRDTLTPVTFRNGGNVLLAPNKPLLAGPKSRPEHDHYFAPGARLTLIKSGEMRKTRDHEIKPHERIHFASKRMREKQFLETLAPTVHEYAKNGIRKPRDVAARLNADRRRTANGSQWTPRLAFLLLGLIWGGPESSKSKLSPVPSGPNTKAQGKQAPSAKISLSPTEIELRLSALGHVVKKET